MAVVGDAMRGGPGGDLGGVERDEGNEIGPAVAIDGHLGDERRFLERVLDVLRRDVLAGGGDDQVFLAVHDAHEAVAVHRANVAGAEPATQREGLVGSSGVVVVAREDAGAAHQDLGVLVQPQLVAGEDCADGAEAIVGDAVEREAAAGFGEAPAFQQHDASGVEKFEDFEVERGGGGDGELNIAAERLTYTVEDEPVGQTVAQAQVEGDALVALAQVADAAADALSPAEDVPLCARAGLDARLDGGIRLLVDARDAEEEVGLGGFQVVYECVNALRDDGGEAAVHAGEVFLAAEDVGEGQEEQVYHAGADGV